MIKYIVGGVIVILTWILAILMELGTTIPLLITLVVVLVIVLMVGIDKLRERRSARHLEKALQAQAAQEAASARPDLQHEIAEMQAEFAKAVSALKTSKKGGKKALYALPWYAIIGPPGSGKSTALRNSGLQFPYLSASGGGVRGLGGTRNCDWWMTSEAVILDTAGRWTSEDEDHDEWLGFLDLIKRFRPKKPLNGIIAAISVGDVGGAREDEVVQLARRLRDRIDEVQGRLSLSLPVYVLFTKCDLLPGFVETFGDMSKQDRGQVWGFTAPLTKNIGSPGEYFAKGFDELLGVLQHRSLKLMSEERKVSNREMIYCFPQQLSVLRSNLQEFVHHLFLENVFKETPRPRGVYFTSGTQEGRPIDRVMSAMAEAFGQPQVQLPAAQVESKSYFLRDTFANVVFQDADVAIRSPEEIKRQRNRTIMAAAAIFAFAVGISGLPGIAWAANRSYLAETREMIDDARELVTPDDSAPVSANELEGLRARAMQLEEYSEGGAPFHMRMGLYQDDVFEPVQRIYLDALRRRVVGPLVRADVQAMEDFSRRIAALGPTAQPDAVEMRAMYERMKLHLLLTVPRGEHEPPLDDDLREFIAVQLSKRWRDATRVERHDPQTQLIRLNIDHYVAMLESHEELYFARSPTAIGQMRGVFAAAGGPRMAVQGIIAEVDRDNCDIRFNQLVGQVGAVQARSMVRCAFTRRAWENRVENMLDHDAARFFGERWVLGQEPPESARHEEIERERQVAELKSYFLEQYVTEWQTFIDSIYVIRATGDQEHMVTLNAFTGGQPQLVTRLIRQIDYNVSLTPPEAAGPGAAAERARREAERAAAARLGRTRGLGATNAARLLGAGTDRAQQAAEQAGVAAVALPPSAMTPERVRTMFEGFLAFAPPEQIGESGNRATEVTPARTYEEQLEYVVNALQSKMSGTNITDLPTAQTRARTITEQLIAESDERWRSRLTTLLMPPILGEAWVPPAPPAAEGAAPAAAPAAAAPAAPAPPPRRRRRMPW